MMRVTEIIAKRYPVAWADAESAERGRLAHEACFRYLSDCAYIPPPFVAGYVTAFAKVLDARDIQVVAVEPQLCDGRVIGHPDLIVAVSGAVEVWDLKTGSPSPSWNLQLAAYWYLAERIFPVRRAFIVILGRGGDERVKEITRHKKDAWLRIFWQIYQEVENERAGQNGHG